MPIDSSRFFKACNPSRTLNIANPEDRQYYIEFAPVRGSSIVHKMQRTIELRSDEATCQLFTGHIGCGKSTELLRLKAELEQQKFYVVYFESNENLDQADVEVTDILFAIAQRVSEQLEADNIRIKPNYFINLLQEVSELMQTPIDISQIELSTGIAKVTARTKDSQRLRDQLRQRIEPRTNSILQSINTELLQEAKHRLRQQGWKELVVIVDNLDRVDQRQLATGRSQPEHLFIDRGDQLSRLACHVVYTIPLILTFSDEIDTLRLRLGGGNAPQVLPMVPVRQRTGAVHEQGLTLLRQLILTRAFPTVEDAYRMVLTPEIFQSAETLDHLCLASGGHIRNLLSLLCNCLQQQNPPFPKEVVAAAIQGQRDLLARPISNDEWDAIFQVVEQQNLSGDFEYQKLFRSMFVFEYQDEQGAWYSVNPVLQETQKYQAWSKARRRT